ILGQMGRAGDMPLTVGRQVAHIENGEVSFPLDQGGGDGGRNVLEGARLGSSHGGLSEVNWTTASTQERCQTADAPEIEAGSGFRQSRQGWLVGFATYPNTARTYNEQTTAHPKSNARRPAHPPSAPRSRHPRP